MSRFRATTPPRRAPRPAGFALFELLVVVAIVGILAVVAVPSFERFLIDARRADGRNLLRLNAQRLQRCFTLEGSYDGGCWLRTESSDGHYRLADPPDLTPTTYTLRAVPVEGSSQARDDACATLVYEHTGALGATGTDGARCW